jgi:hypothetical protein
MITLRSDSQWLKTVSREPKKDKSGRVVGERAEGVRQDGKQFTSVVIFTLGSDFLEINSTSQHKNLELEKFVTP